MTAVILHMLRRSTGAILGWGLSLALLGFYLMQFYDTLADQRAMIEQLISQYPPELMAFFGGGENAFSPQGYLSMEFFSIIPVVIGIYAILSGCSLLLGDEEAGILDLLLAHPISRSRFFLGRVAAIATALAVILGIVWIAFIGGVAVSEELNLSALELLRPFIALFALLFLFQSLSLFLSMILPSRSMAALVSGLLLVGSYFINALAGFDETVKKVSAYLPMKYYQSGYAVDGLNSDWLLRLFGAGLFFVALTWALFLRRDIRVSGEGSWRLPAWPRLRVQGRKST
ncbi:MAG: putative ABC transporter permease [Anaerolineaceae bacterium]|nr:MAG: putative ABC transporter permease [Anaerolineaceae bacterium]